VDGGSPPAANASRPSPDGYSPARGGERQLLRTREPIPPGPSAPLPYEEGGEAVTEGRRDRAGCATTVTAL